jgi:hypothetical protein
MASLPAVTGPAAAAESEESAAATAADRTLAGPRGMPAAWLRDNCPCALCRDPVSGQRLLHITDIPADIAVAEVTASPTSSAGPRRC